MYVIIILYKVKTTGGNVNTQVIVIHSIHSQSLMSYTTKAGGVWIRFLCQLWTAIKNSSLLKHHLSTWHRKNCLYFKYRGNKYEVNSKTSKHLCFGTFLFCLGSFFQHVWSFPVFQDASGSACLCLRNSVLLNTLDNKTACK